MKGMYQINVSRKASKFTTPSIDAEVSIEYKQKGLQAEAYSPSKTRFERICTGCQKSTFRGINNLLSRINKQLGIGWVYLLATLRLNLVLEGLKLIYACSNVTLVE